MLALADARAAMFAGLPRRLRKTTGRLRRDLGLNPARMRLLRHPTVVWMLHAGTVWFWHAKGPYDLTLENEWVHQLEHLSFLVTAVLFWRVLVAPRLPIWPSLGYRVLLVFTMAVQGVLLAALITFAESPWYSGYSETTGVWDLTPLADQQLAGVIMWIPSGPIYTIAGLVLLVTWIRQSTTTGRDAIRRA
ncbi:MAG: hypothetical protein GEU79_04795 [Acidimicrobiia bacterium]|nr:hypothetical protein [Acidimicrobiia bacterium]